MKTEKPENEVRILAYIIAEVRRQGHEFWRYNPEDPYGILLPQIDGPQRTLWMLEAWEYAKTLNPDTIDIDCIINIGSLIEQKKNITGFRECGVRVGSRICVDWHLVPDSVEDLLNRRKDLTPEEFYKEFLEIHPFVDGNGRAGKVVYSLIRGELDDPKLPPNFWGCSNP